MQTPANQQSNYCANPAEVTSTAFLHFLPAGKSILHNTFESVG